MVKSDMQHHTGIEKNLLLLTNWNLEGIHVGASVRIQTELFLVQFYASTPRKQTQTTEK